MYHSNCNQNCGLDDGCAVCRHQHLMTSMAMGPPFQPDHQHYAATYILPAIASQHITAQNYPQNYHNFLSPAMSTCLPPQIFQYLFNPYLQMAATTTGNTSWPTTTTTMTTSSNRLNYFSFSGSGASQSYWPLFHNCHSSNEMSCMKMDYDSLNSSLRDDSESHLKELIKLPEDSEQTIDVDVLMPNGTMITVNVAQNCTFLDIKEEVFELSQRGPMYGALRDRKLYSFGYVDEFGAQREIDDEEIRLCDACPIGNLLKLIEHQENSHDLEFDEQIGQLIGKSLKDFEALLNPEVNEFRYRMRSLCEEIVKTRQSNCWLDKMRYSFPTGVDPRVKTCIPKYISDRLPQDGHIDVEIIFQQPKFSVQVSVNCQMTADELIRQSIEYLLEQNTSRNREISDNESQANESDPHNEHSFEETYYESSFLHPIKAQQRHLYSMNSMDLDANQYLLKINGSLEYLLDNHQLIEYKMIQEFILSNEMPIKLLAIHRQTIEFEDEPIYSVPAAAATNDSFRQRSQSVISLGSMASSGICSSTATNNGCVSAATAKRRAQQVIISSWSLDRKLLIKIHSAHINQLQFNSEITRVAVMVGIFHGGEMLCDSHITTPITLADLMKSSPKNPNIEIIDTITWEEDIVFNLKVSDLPRMARIAFTVVGFTGSQSNRKISQMRNSKPIPIAWANINFFDYRGQLWESSTTLSMWLHDNEDECVDDAQSVFNPLGTVVPNPNIDQTIFLTISFTKYSEGDNTIIRFPQLTDILSQYAINNQSSSHCSMITLQESEYESSFEMNNQTPPPDGSNKKHSHFPSMASNDQTPPPSSPPLHKSETNSHNKKHSITSLSDNVSFEESREDKLQNLALIKKISQEDLLHRIEEKHRDLLWRLRFECCKQVPESLCKLLISFKWNNQKLIGEALALLHTWPKLSPAKALELLDYAYADSFVRKFAIECLKDLSNEDLSQYLLQLVQALKYESYIYNDLVQFLLERAFESQRIGHHLFWLLRSEMHNPAVSVTFGLILEAYCRGAIDHVHILSRQMEFLNKLKRINIIIRDDRSRENREKKIGWMQEILAQRFYQDTLTNVINPLNPVYKMGRLKVEKCKFMDSKMKPLWLVFQNQDQAAGDIYLIFKNGDDLRQDMLTLQMIRIMDHLWKEAGYDFRMTPYRCISVEHCVGLIEVVLNADTIANIQKEKGATAIAAFKKGSLLAWLRDHNPEPADLNRAIEQFTLSCAGYCVATYILGVADRHNDNIMVKKNGQLFHIDFGHILGKFKEKFGIRRERVPFVLTHDLVYVITQGHQSSKKSEYFQRFQRYCEEAFIIIRRRGSFFISLFAMMLSTGMPEISSVSDLQYLRETLVLDKNEEEARIHFKSKFMEALKNSWKTSLNWWAHTLAKDNRMNDR